MNRRSATVVLGRDGAKQPAAAIGANQPPATTHQAGGEGRTRNQSRAGRIKPPDQPPK
jgi:hypothetical protein